jgi:hypothetical protein
MIMPTGTTPAGILDRGRKLADPILAHSSHPTTRQHVLLWGDTRCH